MSLVRAKENLPLPYVEYPLAWDGAFPGFRAEPDGPIFFCECQRLAISNRLALWAPGPHSDRVCCYGFNFPNTGDFPHAFIKPILDLHPSSEDIFTNSLQFKACLCHQCNRRIPNPQYQLNLSTDAFSTLFRSYKTKLAFEHGVDLYTGFILSDRCSTGIREIVPYHPYPYRNSTDSWEGHWKYSLERGAIWGKYLRQVLEFVQNQLRNFFGFPQRGPRLTSETILFLRTVSAFPEYRVIRHHHPHGFRGLSFDIFIPDLATAIEYQGVQHFKPLEHWGGELALAKTRERDARKARLCDEVGISLIYFDDNVIVISEDEIRNEVLNHLKRSKKVKGGAPHLPSVRKFLMTNTNQSSTSGLMPQLKK